MQLYETSTNLISQRQLHREYSHRAVPRRNRRAVYTLLKTNPRNKMAMKKNVLASICLIFSSALCSQTGTSDELQLNGVASYEQLRKEYYLGGRFSARYQQ